MNDIEMTNDEFPRAEGNPKSEARKPKTFFSHIVCPCIALFGLGGLVRSAEFGVRNRDRSGGGGLRQRLDTNFVQGDCVIRRWPRVGALVLWLVATIILTSGTDCCISQEYEVQGKIRHKTMMADKVQFEAIYAFHVQVRGCDWSITTTDLENGAKVEIAYVHRMAYRLNTFTKSGSNVFGAMIEHEEVPVGDGSEAAFLWLAYASSCRLRTTTNHMLTPVWILDDPNLRYEGFKLRATWAQEVERPGLPHHVSYFNDGMFHSFNPANRQRQTFAAPKPYDQGYLNAAYEVNEKTNVAGLVLPTGFTFIRYMIPLSARALPNSRASSNSPSLTITNLEVRTLVTVNDATCTKPANPEKPFLPTFEGQLPCIDRTFVASNPPSVDVVRIMTNGTWPTIDAAQAKQPNH